MAFQGAVQTSTSPTALGLPAGQLGPGFVDVTKLWGVMTSALRAWLLSVGTVLQLLLALCLHHSLFLNLLRSLQLFVSLHLSLLFEFPRHASVSLCDRWLSHHASSLRMPPVWVCTVVIDLRLKGIGFPDVPQCDGVFVG